MQWTSVSRYSNYRNLRYGTGLRNRRKYHQEGEYALGTYIAVVDPEPVTAVARSNVCAKILAFNRKFTQSESSRSNASCPTAKNYAKDILDRLIDSSNLRPMVDQGDFSITLNIKCVTRGIPDAEMKAGLLELTADIILLQSTEDEVAAVLAHELAHHALAHDHDTLAHFSELTPFALKRLEIKHEEDADAGSLNILSNAGYDPYAAVDALKATHAFMKKQKMQSDDRHPGMVQRIVDLEKRFHQGSFQHLPRYSGYIEMVKNELKSISR